MVDYIVFIATLLGLLLGSFTNALVYRLPRGESLMTRSHCTTCFHQIAWYENIPVVSWLFLRGRCSGCRQTISARYPLVELGMATVFGLLATRASALGEGYLFTVGIFLTFAFIGGVVGLIDLDTRKIPTNLVYGGLSVVLALGIAYSLVTGDTSRPLTALVAMAVFFLVHFILWLWKPGAMGFGDVRLSLLTGFVTGWVSAYTALMAFFLPSVLALIWLLPALIGKKASGKTAIPFGPWMVLGALLSVLVTDIAFA